MRLLEASLSRVEKNDHGSLSEFSRPAPIR
jgi:hypothetical protein